MINRLIIRCDNYSHGCIEGVKLEYYDVHEKQCDYLPLKCMNTGCEVTVLRKDMLAHEKECHFRLVVCRKGCGFPVAADQEQNHSCVAVLKSNMEGTYSCSYVYEAKCFTNALFAFLSFIMVYYIGVCTRANLPSRFALRASWFILSFMICFRHKNIEIYDFALEYKVCYNNRLKLTWLAYSASVAFTFPFLWGGGAGA